MSWGGGGGGGGGVLYSLYIFCFNILQLLACAHLISLQELVMQYRKLLEYHKEPDPLP